MPVMNARRSMDVSMNGSAALQCDHSRYGPGDDLEIEPQRPAIDVLEIALDPPVEVGIVPRADLPETGDAGFHRQPPPVPDVIALDLGGQRRARPDEAHLAAQHVPQLR